MSEPSFYFDEVNERQGVFSRRTFLMGGLAGAGVLALSGRLVELQVVQADRYRLMASENQYNFRLVPPPRGLIVDRNGVALASNRPNFRVMLTKDQVDDVDATVQALSEIAPLSPEKRRAVMRDIEQSPRFAPVSVLDDLTWEQFAAVNVRLPELPGVTADMGEARVYPFGGAFAHVIGYVAKVSDTDLKVPGAMGDPLMHNPGFRIGKQGVEKTLDLELRGKAGGRKVEVDSRGRVIREDPQGDVKAVPGKEIKLTLDADVQSRALEVFKEESGAAVMMDCRTGDILCMASSPAFDPNLFVTGAPAPYYRALSTYERKPLLDKALSSTYPPGSTFKTLVSLAALENGYDPKTVHVCGKSWPWGGRVWHCDRAHGALDMSNAIKTSCDIYFYQVALSLGPDKMAEMARRFGLGQVFDIDVPGEHRGLVPDTAYKRKAFPRDPVWHPGETPSMGIGQGYLNVNPLQLCIQAARIANGSKAVVPRLVHSIGGVEQPAPEMADLSVNPAHLQFVRDAMRGVVNDPNGTAASGGQGKLDLGPIVMAGKTGTAQSHNYGGGIGAHGAQGAWALRDHAWFIAYAPADDPKYALSVLVEHGGFGAAAAVPRAREIMRVALLKDPEIRARVEKPLPSPSAESSAPLGEVDAGSGVDAPPPPPTPADGLPDAPPT